MKSVSPLLEDNIVQQGYQLTILSVPYFWQQISPSIQSFTVVRDEAIAVNAEHESSGRGLPDCLRTSVLLRETHGRDKRQQRHNGHAQMPV